MLSITNDSNYLAKVVKLGKPGPHPNAERLLLWNVDGYDVITDLSSHEGDIKVFFPVESQIHDRILSVMNMYNDKSLNADQTKTGYISKHRRVKAVALRGVYSDGILLPLKDIMDIFQMKGDPESLVGVLFDTINDVVICNKYAPAIRESANTGDPKKRGQKVSDWLVENQFSFHYDTKKLQENIYKFGPQDQIVVTDKWHGTSAVFSNLLTKKKLNWFLQILYTILGLRKTQYSKLYASRSVIKHIAGKYHTENQGYYQTDIWGKVFKQIEHVLFPGYTIYGEIVGYQGENKFIQKDYTYGCEPGTHKLVVYRITETKPNNQTTEFSWEEIKDFCREHNLEHVKELYLGTVEDFCLENREPDLLLALKNTYLEKDCKYNPKMPAEGVCIRNESGTPVWYKLKSKRFLGMESADLDSATTVLE